MLLSLSVLAKGPISLSTTETSCLGRFNSSALEAAAALRASRFLCNTSATPSSGFIRVSEIGLMASDTLPSLGRRVECSLPIPGNSVRGILLSSITLLTDSATSLPCSVRGE